MAKGSTVKTKTVAGDRPVARTGRTARSEAPGEQVAPAHTEQPKAAAITTTTGTARKLDAQAVARRAYEIFEREGCPQGRDVEHWLRAETELSSGARA